MINLPLFEKPKHIESQFRPEADLILYQGDVKEFVASIPANSVSLIVTSPPYNLGKDYEDRTSIEKYLDVQAEVIAQLYGALKEEGSLCWQVGNFVQDGEVYPWIFSTIPYSSVSSFSFATGLSGALGTGYMLPNDSRAVMRRSYGLRKATSIISTSTQSVCHRNTPVSAITKGRKKASLQATPMAKTPLTFGRCCSRIGRTPCGTSPM